MVKEKYWQKKNQVGENVLQEKKDRLKVVAVFSWKFTYQNCNGC